MKKPGQPNSAIEITAGRKSLLGQLRYGVADRAAQSMAANWLRDLTVHHGESLRRLEVNATYNALMTGTLNNAASQNAAADWIEGLVLAASDNPILTPNEQRAAIGLPSIKENSPMPEYHDQPSGADDDDKAHGIDPHQEEANRRQVGGDHYQKPVQHWDFVGSNDYGYLEGQITKYLFRWRDKNGVQDLEKAAHFLQKLGEVAESDVAPINLQVFLDANDIPEEERSIYVALHAYHGTLDPTFLEYARSALARVVAKARRTVPHQPV